MIKHPLPDRTDVCIASEASLDLDAARSLLGVCSRAATVMPSQRRLRLLYLHTSTSPPPSTLRCEAICEAAGSSSVGCKRIV